jgi:hypothetical protein
MGTAPGICAGCVYVGKATAVLARAMTMATDARMEGQKLNLTIMVRDEYLRKGDDTQVVRTDAE